MSPTRSLHSTTQKLKTPMSFDQFEFHLRNMYFKAGRSFREPRCPSLRRCLTTPVSSVKASLAAMGP